MRRLLIRPGAIGDCVLSLPALEAARADYTEIWAPRAVLPLIRFADRTRAIADTGIDLVGVVEDARCPALEEFDSIYSWYGTNRPEFQEAVKHLPFTFFPALPPPDGIPRITVPAAPRENFAVIHPFSGSAKKNWPIENFRALASKIGIETRFCAGPEDRLEGAVHIDDLYELACWISRAKVFIGNDSGIGHVAAAVGTPAIAIFISTDSRMWAPRGERVAVLENPGVDEVARAASRYL